MIRVCYRCNIIMGEKEPFEDKSETHGLCNPCLVLELADIQKAKEERRSTMDANKEFLTEIESALLAVLGRHEGQENAISRTDLVEQVNNSLNDITFGERCIRMTIKHLVERHSKWIGSCHNGYFIITEEKELSSVCNYYRNYGLSMLHIEARLRKISMAQLMGQLSLELSQPINPKGLSYVTQGFSPDEFGGDT